MYINKDTHSLGSFVTRVFAVDSDLWVDDDYIRYNVTDDAKFIPWDYPNVTRTDRLFELDEGIFMWLGGGEWGGDWRAPAPTYEDEASLS